MQVECKKCEHKFYITRKLLGMEPMKRIPADTYRKLGLMGSLTTYRVAEKIVGSNSRNQQRNDFLCFILKFFSRDWQKNGGRDDKRDGSKGKMPCF